MHPQSLKRHLMTEPDTYLSEIDIWFFLVAPAWHRRSGSIYCALQPLTYSPKMHAGELKQQLAEGDKQHEQERNSDCRDHQ